MADHEETQHGTSPQQHKIKAVLCIVRGFTILFTVGYFFPIFGNPISAYYNAIMANAVTSTLCLYQCLPQVTVTEEFITQILNKDSYHDLFYSLIFLSAVPATLAWLPIVLLAVLYLYCFLFTVLAARGNNSWWDSIISLGDLHSQNILRMVAFTETLLMPLLSFQVFMGRAHLLTLVLYYQFLQLRYSSKQKPYIRNMFAELRLMLESIANQPSLPGFLRNALFNLISIASRLAPCEAPAQ